MCVDDYQSQGDVGAGESTACGPSTVRQVVEAFHLSKHDQRCKRLKHYLCSCMTEILACMIIMGQERRQVLFVVGVRI